MRPLDLNAMKERTRDELIPFLIESTDDEVRLLHPFALACYFFSGRPISRPPPRTLSFPR